MYVHDHGGSLLISITRIHLANISAMFSHSGEKRKEGEKKWRKKERLKERKKKRNVKCVACPSWERISYFYGHSSVESLLISRNAILPYL